MGSDAGRPRPDGIDECTAWALAARDGDPVAAAAFIRATQAEMWRFVAALVDPGAADDLTQETYLRAFRALPAFEGALHRPHLAVRHRPPGLRRPPAGHGPPAPARWPARPRWGWPPRRTRRTRPAIVGAAELLGRLGRRQREAFVLTQVLGLSYEEAAQSLDVPIGTIRSRVARARMTLVQRGPAGPGRLSAGSQANSQRKSLD